MRSLVITPVGHRDRGTKVLSLVITPVEIASGSKVRSLIISPVGHRDRGRKVELHGQSAALVAPQLAALAAWGARLRVWAAVCLCCAKVAHTVPQPHGHLSARRLRRVVRGLGRAFLYLSIYLSI